jgi:hypothetical protein
MSLPYLVDKTISPSTRRPSWYLSHLVYFSCKKTLVCLLTLKHLVSLQAHVRPSIQDVLDLHTGDNETLTE